jgi:hypothetical protein
MSGRRDEATLARLAQAAKSPPTPSPREPEPVRWTRIPGFFDRWRVVCALVILPCFILAPVAIALAVLEVTPWWWAVGGLLAVTATAVLLLALDAATWRARLPFRLEGLDRLSGSAPREKDHEPLIEFEVHVTLERPSSPPPQALIDALTILAGTLNQRVASSAWLRELPEARWEVKGEAAHGMAGLFVWHDALIEAWARGPLRLLHRLHPIAQVSVRAHLTGRTFYVAPPPD